MPLRFVRFIYPYCLETSGALRFDDAFFDRLNVLRPGLAYRAVFAFFQPLGLHVGWHRR